MGCGDEGELEGIRRALMWVAVLLFLILLVVAIPHILDIRQRNMEKSKRENLYNESIEEREIDLARNTLYKNGVVSTMIARVAPDAVWEYWFSDLGSEVVEVRGAFPADRLSDAIRIINQKEYFGPDDSLVAERGERGWELSPEKVEKIMFKMQFKKLLEDETPRKYNNYGLDYREIRIAARGGGSVEIQPSDILGIFEAYIRKVVWKQET